MLFKKFIFFTLIFSFSAHLFGQTDSIKYDVSITGLTSTGKFSPFWFGSKNYGLVSTSPNSAFTALKISKEFGEKQRIFDYTLVANAISRIDNDKKEVFFHELYGGIKIWLVTLSGGFKEEILGNQDSILSSGGFMYSQNAAPIPKVSLVIDHFKPLPNAKDIEMKGGISHGWFRDNIYTKNMLYHHKYLYLRFKYPEYRFWVDVGLDHSAEWGGTFPDGTVNQANFANFKKVMFGQGGGMESEQTEKINALGNHLVSQSIKVEGYLGNFKIDAYWQNLSEDGPIILLWNTMNIRDGIWGLTVKNNDFPILKGFLYEYINTSDQSGPFHDRDGVIYGGNDNYFNNSLYLNGWTYYGRTIGTPFITSPVYNEDGTISVTNNRVQAHHFGFNGDFQGYHYKLFTTFSKNYGLYNKRFSEMKPNTSLFLEIDKKFPKLWDIEGRLSLGADFGTMYGNSVGCMLSFRKTGLIFKY